MVCSREDEGVNWGSRSRGAGKGEMERLYETKIRRAWGMKEPKRTPRDQVSERGRRSKN